MLIYSYFAVKDPDCYAPAMLLTKNINISTLNLFMMKNSKLQRKEKLPIFVYNLSINFFLESYDECTYRFNVILTSACPNTSLNDFISIPTLIHLVANVCLKQ